MRSWSGVPYQAGFPPVGFLYINRKYIEKEILDMLPLIIAVKPNKLSWNKPDLEEKPSTKKISKL